MSHLSYRDALADQPCPFLVLVAMRVHALYGGRPWIRRTLWLAGSLFLISGIVITTIGQISVTR